MPGPENPERAETRRPPKRKSHDVDPALVTGKGIERLVSFLPRLSGPSADQGSGPGMTRDPDGVIILQPAALSEAALDFIRACHEENFIQPFDWTAWLDGQGKPLDINGFLARADLPDLIRLLSAGVRIDRFVEGHLLCLFRNGTVAGILRRLEKIAVSTDRLGRK